MRASKRQFKVQSSKFKVLKTKSKNTQHSTLNIRHSPVGEIHISGAEGLYGFSEVDKIAKDYFTRAMEHPKGIPDRIVITIENVKQKPLVIPLLPISTVRCGLPDEAAALICGLLSAAGVSRSAIRKGMKVVAKKTAMHGAALISVESAIRMEPDRQRGIRVSRLGIEKNSETRLSRRLARKGINTLTVKEAIILASKVASCRDVIAELCISDDPDYTTGYVASKGLGYVRIPNIKEKGSPCGGRVFFVREGAEIEKIISYLEKRPVIVAT